MRVYKGKTHHKAKVCISLLSAFLFASSVAAIENVVIVVHPDNPINQLSKSDVINLYMGRNNTFVNGNKAITFDLSDDSNLKKVFYKALIGRSIAQVNAYWSRVKFSGRATPPIKLTSHAEILTNVSSSLSAIGYLPLSEVSPDVKVVFTFNE